MVVFVVCPVDSTRDRPITRCSPDSEFLLNIFLYSAIRAGVRDDSVVIDVYTFKIHTRIFFSHCPPLEMCVKLNSCNAAIVLIPSWLQRVLFSRHQPPAEEKFDK